MKAFEFQACVSPEGTVQFPADLQDQVRPDQPVRILVLVNEPDEDAAWANLATQQFFQGFDASDAIYDDLQDR